MYSTGPFASAPLPSSNNEKSAQILATRNSNLMRDLPLISLRALFDRVTEISRGLLLFLIVMHKSKCFKTFGHHSFRVIGVFKHK